MNAAAGVCPQRQAPNLHDAAPHAEASKHPAIVAAAFDIGKQIAVIGG
jgi:hypothetical protein